jgi:hypothetical protein
LAERSDVGRWSYRGQEPPALLLLGELAPQVGAGSLRFCLPAPNVTLAIDDPKSWRSVLPVTAIPAGRPVSLYFACSNTRFGCTCLLANTGVDKRLPMHFN